MKHNVNIYYIGNESPAGSTLMSIMDGTVKLLLPIWGFPSSLIGFPDSGYEDMFGYTCMYVNICGGMCMCVCVQVHVGVASEFFTLGCQCCVKALLPH